MKYGYARVSARDQNPTRQIEALKAAGTEVIFQDYMSGKDFERENYKRMVKKLRCGDVLIIKSIDRLGRNYNEIQDQWRILTKDIGVYMCVLDMPLLDTRGTKDLLGTFIADVVLQVLSFVAENERINIKERQKEGIAIAKARGVKFGRPALPRPEAFTQVQFQYHSGLITSRQAAKMLNVSQGTFLTWNKMENKKAQK